MSYLPGDEEFDLTCRCGENHDECGLDCQCECHGATVTRWVGLDV